MDAIRLTKNTANPRDKKNLSNFGFSKNDSQKKGKVRSYQLGIGFDSEEIPVIYEYAKDFFHDLKFKEQHLKLEAEREYLQMQQLQLAKNIQQEKIFKKQQEQEEKQKLQKQFEIEEKQKIAAQVKLEEEKQQKMLAQQMKLERQQAFFAFEKEKEEKRKQKEQERMEREYQRNQQILKKKLEKEEKLRLKAEIMLKKEEEKSERRKQEGFERQQAILASEREREERQIIKNKKKLEKEHQKLLKMQKKEFEKQRVMLNKRLALEEKERKKLEKERIRNQQRARGEDFTIHDLINASNLWFRLDIKRSAMMFATVAVVLAASIGSIAFANKGLSIKDKVLGISEDGYENLNDAIKNVSSQNFSSSSEEFSKAYENFEIASRDLEEMGTVLIGVSRYIPFFSKLSSGKNIVEAGKHISAAGKALNEVAKEGSQMKNPLDKSYMNVSLLDSFKISEENIKIARDELIQAKKYIDKVDVDDLPKDKQEKFITLKEKLPDVILMMEGVNKNSHIFVDILGGNGPRKYLFLFQNNNEMRATGGFIGSYGLLEITNGNIRNFFIDGIFNPDGQLKDKIVPPLPIQKISAAWSLHDSNWFADFPTSAKKAVSFYEKTGGPTVDGVISITPFVMQKMLEATGPIYMSDYDVTLDSENFIENTQYEVEVDYDKKENKPKKILSDLAPVVFERLLNSKDPATIAKAALAISEGLSQKHILLYSENSQLQNIISDQGWSGEVLPSQKDYISVINTNINGYKTDGVIEEKIDHNTEVQSDGSIVDTVTITRKHNGGDSKFDWWNKVNADYMRVYVPQGSTLIEATGQTREINNSPIDYDALGFERDEMVTKEENSITIDENTGTRIYNENGKTVFANWVYVSPKETVVVSYKYLLPFKLFQFTSNSDESIDSYSLVAQKQSGSVGSEFNFQISYPWNYSVKWNYPDIKQDNDNIVQMKSNLVNDKFVGLIFEKK